MFQGLFHKLGKRPHEIGSVKISILQMGRERCIHKNLAPSSGYEPWGSDSGCYLRICPSISSMPYWLDGVFQYYVYLLSIKFIKYYVYVLKQKQNFANQIFRIAFSDVIF